MFWPTPSPDEMRKRLREIEAELAELRCEQSVLVSRLDKINIAAADGHRSMTDWLTAELDVTRNTATDLLTAGRQLKWNRRVESRLGEGDITFDRAVATVRLADAGADADTLDHAESLDLADVGKLTAKQRRITRRSEKDIAASRYVSIQPTLDESSWRLSGLLGSVEGRIIEHALHTKADELRLLPGGEAGTRAQRQADALAMMAQEALDRNDDSSAGTGGSVAILVDLDEANGTGGETGASIEYGPSVGPDVLEKLLCTGTVQIIGLRGGTPVVTSQAARAIPPAVRRLVAQRDGGCTVAGCTSRYRLEPHHIIPRSEGGTHDPTNLATLCWYHHHVAIHTDGFRIDPSSPPTKRRLLRPLPHGPPDPR